MKLWASSWVPALNSVLWRSDFIFLLLLESMKLRAATAHRRTCLQTHLLALLLWFKWDSAACCYLFEIKRATSSSLVITLMHTDSTRWCIVRGAVCINLESFCKHLPDLNKTKLKAKKKKVFNQALQLKMYFNNLFLCLILFCYHKCICKGEKERARILIFKCINIKISIKR